MPGRNEIHRTRTGGPYGVPTLPRHHGRMAHQPQHRVRSLTALFGGLGLALTGVFAYLASTGTAGSAGSTTTVAGTAASTTATSATGTATATSTATTAPTSSSSVPAATSGAS